MVVSLLAAGVEVVFGLPGVHNLALWQALARSGIRLVTVRHEQTAAYAADGYARATGRVGVALTTTGPGAANTLGAVGEAWASRSPVVVVATDIPSTLRRPGVYGGALHEMTDQASLFEPLTKRVIEVPRAAMAGEALTAAIAQALEPPSRPVYLQVPTDFLSARIESGDAVEATGPYIGLSEPDSDELDSAVGLIEHSRRPLVWAGGGAVSSGAADAVARLAAKLVAPIFTTYQSRGLVGREHPCAVGLPPHVPEAGRLWDDADLVVAIGSDLDAMMTQSWRMPRPENLVAVNVDPVDASKNYAPDVVVVADARIATSAIAERVGQRPGLDELAHRLADIRLRVREGLLADDPQAVGFLSAFDAAVPSEAVVVADMCIPGYWLAAFHPVPAPRKLAYPVGWGTLGFAFPAAIGSALAVGGPVVSVSGDGGFLFACGELATVVQERVPLTAVIVDDGGYGMLRYDQKNAGHQVFGVDLVRPDFVALAEAFGLRAEKVEGLGRDFEHALRAAIETPGPSVVVASAALDPPPTTSPRWYRARSA